MSEEILEQTAEELEEEQQAVAESSGEEILDEAKTKVKEEDEEEEGEEEVEEAVSVPKTKAGMIKALYDQLSAMKKSDLSDSFSKIMGSTLTEVDEEHGEDDEEEEDNPKYEAKKLKKEDLEIDVKDDIEAITNGEDLSEDFKTKASTIFEAAVSAKVLSEVNQRIEELETNYKKEITDAKEEHLSTVTEKVD